MAEVYEQKTWKNRVAEHPERRLLREVPNEQDQVIVELLRAEGEVHTEGDMFNAETMNNMEGRIADGFKAVKGDIGTLDDILVSLDGIVEDIQQRMATRSETDALADKLSALRQNAEDDISALRDSFDDLQVRVDTEAVETSNSIQGMQQDFARELEEAKNAATASIVEARQEAAESIVETRREAAKDIADAQKAIHAEITAMQLDMEARIDAVKLQVEKDLPEIAGKVSTHTGSYANPHGVTAEQVGALAKDGTAENSARLSGYAATAFITRSEFDLKMLEWEIKLGLI